MEYILGLGILALIGSKFIKNVMNSIVFIGIIIVSIAVAYVYKIPYMISLCLCILVKYGLFDFIVNIKNLSKSIIKSRKRYNEGYLQKLVNILINCNYLLFALICYILLAKELINNYITKSTEEALVASIIVVLSVKILRKILDKTANRY
ncbi:MAG: hypothetical protein ACRDA3_07145 [Peptostreptococcaceae bacterium]